MDNIIDTIKQDYISSSEVVFSEYLRNRVHAEKLQLTDTEIQELLHWSGDNEYVSAKDI